MKVVAFIMQCAVVDRIIRYLKLTFVAEKPPSSYVFEQVAVRVAEESESLLSFSRGGEISYPDMIWGRGFRGY
jgi:hypothetical protein